MRKLYIFILIILIIFPLTGCSNKGKEIAEAKPLNNISYEDRKDINYQELITSIKNFSYKISEKSFLNQDDNFIISPISIYSSLTILEKISNGETKEELLKLLNTTQDIIDDNFIKVLGGIYKNEEYTKVDIINSLWLDNAIGYNEDKISELANDFYVNIRQTNFKNGNANKEIKNYIKDKTNDLLAPNFDLDSDTIFNIITTFYLKDNWLFEGKKLNLTDEYNFKNNDSSIKRLKLLENQYQEGRIYQSNNYETFYATTYKGYKIKVIKPNDNIKVADIFKEDVLKTVNDITNYDTVYNENKKLYFTRTLLPEFNVELEVSIKDILIDEFNLDKVFVESNDFTNLLTSPAYLNDVVTGSILKVTRKGIEGASYTSIPAATSPAPLEYEKVYADFVVDRSFAFILTDSYDIPLFIGVINNL